VTPERIAHLREVCRRAVADKWVTPHDGMIAVAQAAGALPEVLDALDAIRIELDRVRKAAAEAAALYREIGLLEAADIVAKGLEVRS
jgi:transposase